MTNANISWAPFFRSVQKMTANCEVPYVSGRAKDFKSENERAFSVLISTVISLRTKDKVTAEASERLFSLAKTPEAILRLSQSQIEKAIYPAGFYRVKAGNVLEICRILSDRSVGSDISVPSTIEELTELPGVGRKTANLVLTEGLHKPGICVDTHVHRILNRVGFVKTKEPDETEMVLRKILPLKFWRQINYYLVMFGQNVCKPVGPRCGGCLMACQCPHARQLANAPRPPLNLRGGVPKITHVIFDWAGTLYDDHIPSFITSQKTLKKLSGRTLTFADYKTHFTIPVTPFYRMFGVKDKIEVINKTFFDLYAQHYDEGVLFKGVRPALKMLRACGVTMSILSTLRQDYLDKLVKKFKLQKYFTCLQGSVNDKRVAIRKHLKHIQKSSKFPPLPSFGHPLPRGERVRERVTPDQILFIGDTDHDIHAAQSCGILSGCVLNGYHHKERLLACKPDFVWGTQEEWVKFFREGLRHCEEVRQ